MEIESFSDKYGYTRQVSGAAYAAYYPKLLPFNVDYTDSLVKQLSKAHDELAALQAASNDLANPGLLIRPYLRREAYSSTRIEGTRTTLDAVFEADTSSDDEDLEEVMNYVKALRRGLQENNRFTEDELKDLHGVLLSGVRGQGKNPGKYRAVQARIGKPSDDLHDARFVPPPHGEIERLMTNLLGYLNDYDDIDDLLVIAIAHYQFETIHPFSDGNGRLGRLLIPLFLARRGLLTHPLLSLSDYFNTNKDHYMKRLYKVSKDGDLTAWLHHFLNGIAEQSNSARQTITTLQNLQQQYKDRLRKTYRSHALIATLEYIFGHPYTTVPKATRDLPETEQTIRNKLNTLCDENILIKSHKRGRTQVYKAPEILDTLTTT